MWQIAREKGVPDEMVRPSIENFERQHRLLSAESGESHFYFPANVLPVNAFFVVRSTNLDHFIAKKSISSPASSKQVEGDPRSINILVELCYCLMVKAFGEEVANNPRKHFDDVGGVVRILLEQLDFHVPAGQTIERHFWRVLNGR